MCTTGGVMLCMLWLFSSILSDSRDMSFVLVRSLPHNYFCILTTYSYPLSLAIGHIIASATTLNTRVYLQDFFGAHAPTLSLLIFFLHSSLYITSGARRPIAFIYAFINQGKFRSWPLICGINTMKNLGPTNCWISQIDYGWAHKEPYGVV